MQRHALRLPGGDRAIDQHLDGLAVARDVGPLGGLEVDGEVPPDREVDRARAGVILRIPPWPCMTGGSSMSPSLGASVNLAGSGRPNWGRSLMPRWCPG